MDIKKSFFTVTALILLFSSCERLFISDKQAQDHQAVFEYLWQQIDEKYSFFEQKNIDWNEVYTRYSLVFRNKLTKERAFEYMAEMMNELEDGHVNLVSPFNVSYYQFSRNWYPNFNGSLLNKRYIDYLSDSLHTELTSGRNYRVLNAAYQTGAVQHQFMNVDNASISYVRYNSFVYEVGSSQWAYVLARSQNAAGLIIDVRDNGGGDPTNLFRLLERFIEEETYIYTSYLKDGRGHNEFSKGTEAKLKANADNNFLNKPIRVLVNRNCYSATSFFAAAVRSLNNAGVNIKLVGDYTGGGAGAPGGGELPNGWSFRLSVTQTTIKREAIDENEILKGIIPEGMFTDEEFHFEAGVPPHIPVNMEPIDIFNGRDTLLETAIEDILSAK